MDSYVVSTIRPGPGDRAMFEIVTGELQRMYVLIPRKHTDAVTVDATIRAAISARRRRPRPVR